MKFFKRYILGWLLGPLSAVYGVLAMITGRVFLPGLHGDGFMLCGAGAPVLASAYISGGLFLFLRLALEREERSGPYRSLIYAAENVLLLAFICALVYVLVSVDTVQ